MEYMENFDEAEKIDKLKSKILKYILYKKRTEQEVRQKFADEDENMLEDVIQYLKELNYINDFDYIDRSINEFLNLKSLSIKEIKYKLIQKGISRQLVEEYVSQNIEVLQEFEEKSAEKLINKKSSQKEFDEIKNYLYQKGYTFETVDKISQSFDK